MDSNLNMMAMASRLRYALAILALLAALSAALPTLAQEEWYRVQAGDSLAAIAAEFGVTEAAIRQRNGLARQSPILRGQILRIPLPAPTLAPQPTAVSAESGLTHIVRPGETLQVIGERYGLDWQALAQANGILNPNLDLPSGRR